MAETDLLERPLDDAGLRALANAHAETHAAALEAWCARTAPPGARFDEAAAAAACAFFPSYLRHTEAEWAGQPFDLAPWQRATVRMAFGWKLADGSRRFRQVYIRIPKKNGKTEFGAGLCLLLQVGDGEFGGQVFSLATAEDQAKIVFGKAAVMVDQSDALRRELEVYKTSIFCPALHAKFAPLSARPRGKHGFHPSAALADEVHEFADGELVDTVHKGMAGRRQPMEIFITTAGVHGQGYGWELDERARLVWAGEIADPHFLPVLFGAAEDEDFSDPRVWARANPNLGVSPKISFIRDEARKAKESPRLENAFRRFHLNQWTAQAVRWLPMADWRACAGPWAWRELAERLKGRDCYVGVDLGVKRDPSAAVAVFPPLNAGFLASGPVGQPANARGLTGPEAQQEGRDGKQNQDNLWFLLPHFWLPSAVIEHKLETTRRIDDYRRWAAAGALTLTHGNVTDQRAIEAHLIGWARDFRILEIPYDPYSATQFALNLQNDHGLSVVEFTQTVRNYNEPSLKFENLVIDRQLAHGGHPVLEWMAGNVAVYEEPKTRYIKPDKFAGDKIDGIVAAIMALGRALVQESPPVSVYEQLATAARAAASSAAAA